MSNRFSFIENIFIEQKKSQVFSFRSLTLIVQKIVYRSIFRIVRSAINAEPQERFLLSFRSRIVFINQSIIDIAEDEHFQQSSVRRSEMSIVDEKTAIVSKFLKADRRLDSAEVDGQFPLRDEFSLFFFQRRFHLIELIGFFYQNE